MNFRFIFLVQKKVKKRFKHFLLLLSFALQLLRLLHQLLHLPLHLFHLFHNRLTFIVYPINFAFLEKPVAIRKEIGQIVDLLLFLLFDFLDVALEGIQPSEKPAEVIIFLVEKTETGILAVVAEKIKNVSGLIFRTFRFVLDGVDFAQIAEILVLDDFHAVLDFCDF